MCKFIVALLVEVSYSIATTNIQVPHCFIIKHTLVSLTNHIALLTSIVIQLWVRSCSLKQNQEYVQMIYTCK